MPEGHSGQSGRSSDADTLTTQRASYLRAVLRRFGALTLPPGVAPAGAQSLALETIAQPLRLRRVPLAIEDLDEESYAQRLRELQWRRTSEPRTSPLPEHPGEQRQKHPQQRAGELAAESRLFVANVAEALAGSDQRRIVILGSPGSGKTTALKALVSDAARRALNATAGAPESPSQLAPSAPLPLFISLPDLASSGASVEQSIVAYLPAALAAVGVSEVFAVELEQAITNGQALICLDSLDEVAPGERAQMIARINA